MVLSLIRHRGRDFLVETRKIIKCYCLTNVFYLFFSVEMIDKKKKKQLKMTIIVKDSILIQYDKLRASLLYKRNSLYLKIFKENVIQTDHFCNHLGGKNSVTKETNFHPFYLV